MKWLKQLLGIEQKPTQKPAPTEEAPRTTLKIEELEERITPNAIWGD
jgi:hypothetical protein